MAYCDENVGQIDLEGWSLAKLIEIVDDFVRVKSQTTFTQEELDNEDDWNDY